jgi:hypothetical protein
MELLTVLHLLWRRRILVGVGVLLAALAGAVGGGVLPPKAATAPIVTGQAIARVLVDTPQPLAPTAFTEGADTIQARAALLADRMSSGRGTASVAREARIEPRNLTVLGPASGTPTVPSAMRDRAGAAALAAVRTPYVISIRPEGTVPILRITTNAPSRAAAAALAAAAVSGLRRFTAPASATDPVFRVRGAGVVIEQLGAIRAQELAVHGRRGRLLGVIGAIAVLVLWCSGIVFATGLARSWRNAGRRPASAAAAARR